MIFDIVIAAMLVWGAYKGFSKGLVKQLASLAALVIGLWGAYKFSDYTAGLFFPDASNPYIPVISFAITFLILLVLINLLGKGLDQILKSISLNIFNRLFGGLFGVAMYAFIVSIILLVVNKIDQHMEFLPQKEINNSVLYVPLSNFAPAVFPYLDFGKLRDPFENTEEEEKSTET